MIVFISHFNEKSPLLGIISVGFWLYSSVLELFFGLANVYLLQDLLPSQRHFSINISFTKVSGFEGKQDPSVSISPQRPLCNLSPVC